MRKVYITGVGFITSIGNEAKSVSENLRELRHGMVQLFPPGSWLPAIARPAPRGCG